jgi:hypothetical protein
MRCFICGKKIEGQPYVYVGFSYFCSWECWVDKDMKENAVNIRGELK